MIPASAYETAYTALKNGTITTARSATTAYGAVKSTAAGVDNWMFMPIRDYIIMPSFHLAEKSAAAAQQFVESDAIQSVTEAALSAVETHTPFNVGRLFIVPAIRTSWYFSRTWVAVIKYPIPSQQTVSTVTNAVSNSTKSFLRYTHGEVFFYVNLVDVHVTRVFAKAQWDILGFGPYLSLNDRQRAEVVDHICER